jgi:phospholipid transport system substrate-binding protein
VKAWSLFLFGFLLLLSGAARADVSPEAQVKKSTHEILALIKEDKGVKTGDRRRLMDLVDAKVLPHFDFQRMTRLAVGRHWAAASPEQRETLVSEFRNLLVRTYANAFLTYQREHVVDPTVEIRPGRRGQTPEDVTVQTIVRNPGEQPIMVDYDMVKTGDHWKVYDVVVGGVSLVTTYRTTFSQEIQQSGVDGLIRLLKEKNRSPQTSQGDSK